MNLMQLAAVIVALSISWGASNRARGWGPLPGAPAWQVQLANFFNRDTMAAWHGISVILACYGFGVPVWQGIALSACTAVFWRLAVSPGWGEYQDGSKAPNDEIKWIDFTVQFLFTRILPDRFMTANNIDAVSMGLRGSYYLPIFVGAGLILDSYWFALPAAFFWQAGLVYFLLHRKYGTPSDVTALAEWIDDTVRGILFFTAFALAVNGGN